MAMGAEVTSVLFVLLCVTTIFAIVLLLLMVLLRNAPDDGLCLPLPAESIDPADRRAAFNSVWQSSHRVA